MFAAVVVESPSGPATKSRALPARGASHILARVFKRKPDRVFCPVCVCVCVLVRNVSVIRFTRWGTEPCRLCAGHTGAIAAVSACSGVDTLVATAARDRTLRLWDTNEWAQVGGGVVSLCCSHPWGFGGSIHWCSVCEWGIEMGWG